MTTLYHISTGRSRLEQDWQAKLVSWEQLTDRLSRCKRTPETFKDYRAMSRADKGKVKDVGGFVGGTFTGAQRKACDVEGRSLITLDIDYGQGDTIETVRKALAVHDCRWCLYSTHSHSSETPRYRLILPLSRSVTADEYIPVARMVASWMGMNLFDDSTYQPERLMYWPSASSDGEFVFEQGDGDEADPDFILADYDNWKDVTEWPVSDRVQRLATGRGGKQEDPTQKPGIIGAFCRTYSISEAISAFLSDVYAPTDHPDRYTYIGGSTEAGAVVYEDKWLYSHHGTDPCCEKEVNAFDLVRIHRFGNEDADTDPETPVNRMPSFRLMDEMARKDGRVNSLLVRELTDTAADFGGMASEGDEGPDWRSRVKLSRKGLEATPANYEYILNNDPRLKGCVKHDAFRDRIILTRDLPWRKMSSDPYWKNSDDACLTTWLSEAYGSTPITKTTLLDALESVISRSSFHPVRDYFAALPAWDGTPRLDTLLSDYLGAIDNPLTRAMTRKHMVAAVARIMEPGVKYDYVLTLSGSEGLGKSTLIRALGGDWFDDSFSSGDVGSKEAMEQLRGRWLIELGELKDYKKNTVDAFKAFISKQDDSYRPAYGRKTEHYLRQCVFFATTNERSFLKGDTGNRRFWTVEVGVDVPALDVFGISGETRAQIWAEALMRYRQHEPLYLPAELEAQARARQADFNEITTDDRIGVIAACIRRRLPQTWWQMNRAQRRGFYKDSADLDPDAPFVRRETICAMEVQEEFFGQPYDKFRSKDIVQIFGVLGFVPLGPQRTKDKEYGVQKRFKIPDAFYEDTPPDLK